MSSASSLHELKSLIACFHPLITVASVEESRLKELIESACDELDLPLFEWSVSSGLCKYPADRPLMAQTHLAGGALQHIDQLTVRGVFFLKDLCPHLKEPAVARQLRETVEAFHRSGSTFIISGATIELPTELDPIAVPYELNLPDAKELDQLLSITIKSLTRRDPQLGVYLDEGQRRQIVDALAGMTMNQARQSITRVALEDSALDSADIARLREHKAQTIRDGGLLEYYPIEDNQFTLGGFGRLKEWLKRSSVGFTPEAAALNLPAPRGILLVGVQGCGKSLAAKVIAHDWQIPLLKLDAGSLFDKYIGESERNFRKATALAESVAPVVLWIDEMEKAFPSGGGEDADGGTSRRLLGGFLTWLQEKPDGVFVVGTANDLTAMPPELMRKGRFDEIFFVDLPDATERATIFTIHLGLRKQASEEFDLRELAAASDGFSGAEIEQAVVASLYRALYHKVPLITELLLQELRETVPLSVSRADAINRLRQEGKTRFVSVK